MTKPLVPRKIEAIARARAVTPAQVALAWLLHQGHDIHPIPGTTKLQRLEENVAAASLTLSEAELRDLGEALPPNSASGARYAEASMAMIDR